MEVIFMNIYQNLENCLNLQNELTPAFKNYKNAIVFASDDNFADYLGIAIASLIANANPKKFYDIIIFDGGISKCKLYLIFSLAFGHDNVSIRFFDIKNYVKKWEKNFYHRGHISVAMYYRIFIPEICHNFQQILYLDCDLLVNTDIAELLNVDLKNYYVAAAVDLYNPTSLREHNQYLQDISLYLSAENYFNSGVLLFSIKNCAKIDCIGKSIDMLTKYQKLKFPDQDILNVIFKGRVFYLSPDWNFRWDELKYLNDYNLKSDLPKIIHYVGSEKPWMLAQKPLNEFFWKYARNTPFYEKLLFKNIHLLTEATLFRIFVYGLCRWCTCGKLRSKFRKKQRKLIAARKRLQQFCSF